MTGTAGARWPRRACAGPPIGQCSHTTAWASVAAPRGNPVPKVIVNLRYPSPTVTVDLRAWTAYWNTQSFNQGALFTATSYNPITKRVVLDWSSRITSGPFQNFTGNWHVEGRITHLH